MKTARPTRKGSLPDVRVLIAAGCLTLIFHVAARAEDVASEMARSRVEGLHHVVSLRPKQKATILTLYAKAAAESLELQRRLEKLERETEAKVDALLDKGQRDALHAGPRLFTPPGSSPARRPEQARSPGASRSVRPPARPSRDGPAAVLARIEGLTARRRFVV